MPLDAERIAQLLWTSAPLATAEAAVAGLVELVAAAGRCHAFGGSTTNPDASGDRRKLSATTQLSCRVWSRSCRQSRAER